MPDAELGIRQKSDERVLIFLHAFADGGAEAVLIAVANHLHLQGIEVTLVAGNGKGSNRRRLCNDVPVVDLKAHRLLHSLPALIKVLRTVKPTVCLSALTHANLALLLAARVAGISARVVVSERRSLYSEFAESSAPKRSAKRRLISWLYPKADRIIVVSQGLQSEIQSLFPAAADKTIVLANPLDSERLASLAKEPTAFSAGKDGVPVVAFVGRLSPQKNLPLLLNAFAELRKRRAARLVIAGEGPLRLELEQLVSQLLIHEDVIFAGYLDNPYRLIDEAEILALSSDFEGLPNVLIEALALKTKIISTDCPTGPAEILDGGRYGRLVPIGDQAAFAWALEEALDYKQDIDWAEAIRPYEKQNALNAYQLVLCPET